MTDRHVRRTADDYTWGLAALLPVGSAWPRYPDSVLMRVVAGLAEIWGRVDGVAADLLERESDPRSTVVLLPDWERAFGLPDRCLAEPVTISDRQHALVARMTMRGGQSPAFFVALGSSIGWTVRVEEHAPFMVGVSRVGDTRDADPNSPRAWFRWEIGAPIIRFYWNILVKNARITWFRCGAGQCGVDPHVRVGIASDLECIFERYKPAQTSIRFDYSGLVFGGSMAGTP